MGGAGSMVLIFGVLVNVIQQVLMIDIIMTQFTGSSMPSLDSISRFRHSAAHDHKNMDANDAVALAARVCAQDASLIMANGQMQTLQGIISYHAPYSDLFGDQSVGFILTLVVLVVWLVTIVNEMLACITFAISLSTIPRASQTVLSRSDDDSSHSLESITLVRLLVAQVFNAIRLAIAVALGYAGSLWLCYTDNLQNLVLNAGALAYIPTISGLIFTAFAPYSVQMVMATLDPISMPTTKHWRGADIRSVITILLTTVAAIVFMIVYQGDLEDSMMKVQLEMCGKGPVDFVVSLNAGLATPLVVATNEFDPTPLTQEEIDEFWMTRTTSRVISGPMEVPKKFGSSMEYGAVITDSVSNFESLRVFEAHNIFFKICIDTADLPDYSFMLSTLRQMFDVPHARSCSDFKEHCGQSHALRFGCARTCECHLPLSGLYSTEGCPTVCKAEKDVRLRGLPCSDIDSSRPAKDMRALSAFFRNFNVSSNFSGDKGLGVVTDGCEELESDPVFAALCSDSTQRPESRTLQPFCPQSCGCRVLADADADDAGICPPRCDPDFHLPYDDCARGLCLNGTTLRHGSTQDARQCEFVESEVYIFNRETERCEDVRQQYATECCE
jgi:hypothetical protein